MENHETYPGNGHARSNPAGDPSDGRHAARRSLAIDAADHVMTRVQSLGTGRPAWADGSSSSGAFQIWRLLHRHKGKILTFCLAGAVAGILVSILQTPIYRARTSIEIQALNENFLNMGNVSPVLSGPNNPELDIQTQVKILSSESLIERVSAKLGLEKLAEFAPPPQSSRSWGQVFGLSTPTVVPDLREQVLSKAAKNLTIRNSAQNRLVEVFYDSRDPRLAAAFVNALASEFIEQSLEARWNATQHTGEWLERQMNDLKFKLEKSEDELQSYAQGADLIFTYEKENVAEQKLKQLQQEMSKAQTERMAKQSQYEMAASSPPDSLPEVLDDESIREGQTKINDLRRQAAEMSTSLTPANPKVKRVQAQIAETESALLKRRGSIVVRIREDYESASRREDLIAAAYARQSRLVTDQAAKAVHYDVLKREVDTNRQLYETVLQKVKEAGVASAMRASNIRIVDPARPPSRVYRPSLLLNASFGLLAGFFAAMAFVLVRDRADRSLRAPGDAEFYLDVPELGVIPSARIQTRKYLRGEPTTTAASKVAMVVRSNGNGRHATGGRTTGRVELATWQHKSSVVAESYRAVLTSVTLSAQNGNRPRVIVVSSPEPSVGKTCAVSNLGIALAEINQRVLLIDTDMRKPRLHEIFDVSNSWGLSDLLREKNSIEDCPREGLARETAIPGLYLLPSGPGTTSIASLLNSVRLDELLRRMRREFDTILIDTPPMLLFPDARVVGRQADGVVLVVWAGQTSRDSALAAKQRFTEDGTRVLGTILNSWNPAQFPSESHILGYYDQYYRVSPARGVGA